MEDKLGNMKSIRIHLIFHYEKETPYEIDITRQNPSTDQIMDIRNWVNKIITEEIERIQKTSIKA